MMQNFIYSW